jgi:hypothetical protein
MRGAVIRRLMLVGCLCHGAACAQTPLLLEGTIAALVPAGHAAHVTLLGQTVVVDATTTVTTPTARITLAQLLDPAPLPGRTQPGWLEATAKVRGTVRGPSQPLTATTLFVEPAENVVLGIVTGHIAGTVNVNGVPVAPSSDPRLPSRPPTNTFGFPVVLASVPVGSAIAVDGWFAGGQMHAFAVETTPAAQLTSTTPQIAVTKAFARERTPNQQKGDEVEVRGAVTMLHAAPATTTQDIAVWRIDAGVPTFLGTATATRDSEYPQFAAFRLPVTTPPTAHPVLGTAPVLVRAVNLSVGALGVAAEASVTIQ